LGDGSARRAGALVAVVALGLGSALGLAACSQHDGDLQAFCAGISEHRDALLAITPSQTEAELRQQLPTVLDELDQIVDDAPSAIHGPASRLRDLLRELQDTDPSDDAAYARVLLKIEGDDVANDARAFTGYVQDKCGVDLNTPTTAPAATTPSTTSG
jgi:hypothetical protein